MSFKNRHHNTFYKHNKLDFTFFECCKKKLALNKAFYEI